MRIFSWSMVAVATFITLSCGGEAHAQLVDQALSMGIGGATELGAAAPKPISPTTIIQNMQREGYSNVAQAPGGDPTQYTATAPGGVPVAVIVDPVTGRIVSAVPR